MSTPAASMASTNCSNSCRLSAFTHGAHGAETAETAERELFPHGAETAETAETGVAASASGTLERLLLVVLFFVPSTPPIRAHH